MKVARHVPRIRWRRLPRSTVRLSAIVDARGAETLLPACLSSLRDEWLRDGRRADDLEFVVIVATDHALDVERTPSGSTGFDDTQSGSTGFDRAAPDVRVLREDGPRGVALERAVGLTRGSARDVVGFVTADVEFLPGSVRALLERLQSDPDCGAVAPRRFLDEACQLQPTHPPRPTPLEHAWMRAARRFTWIANAQAARQRARNHTLWTAREPVALDTLAPACVWLRRKALARTRGLFHAARAGRMADHDLLARVAEQGYVLLHEPRAHVRGGLRAEELDVDHLWRLDGSRAEYVLRHATPLGRWLERAARWLSSSVGSARRSPGEDLGVLDAPPVFELGRSALHVLELERADVAAVAVGCVQHGAHLQLSDAAWASLADGVWHARVYEHGRGAPVARAHFRKVTTRPFQPVEREQLPVGPSAFADRSS